MTYLQAGSVQPSSICPPLPTPPPTHDPTGRQCAAVILDSAEELRVLGGSMAKAAVVV